MKIFKELKKLGYIHYSATTIEELDDLPLNSAEKISEQALVLRWFREKHKLYVNIESQKNEMGFWGYVTNSTDYLYDIEVKIYEEAELACLVKLIEIVKK